MTATITKAQLTSLLTIVSKDKQRDVLHHVVVRYLNNRPVAAATDGRRLLVVHLGTPEPPTELPDVTQEFVLHGVDLANVSKLAKANATISIDIFEEVKKEGDNESALVVGATAMAVGTPGVFKIRVLTGIQFPNIEMVIPSKLDEERSITFSADLCGDIVEAMGRIGASNSRHQSPAFAMTFRPDSTGPVVFSLGGPDDRHENDFAVLMPHRVR